MKLKRYIVYTLLILIMVPITSVFATGDPCNASYVLQPGKTTATCEPVPLSPTTNNIRYFKIQAGEGDSITYTCSVTATSTDDFEFGVFIQPKKDATFAEASGIAQAGAGATNVTLNTQFKSTCTGGKCWSDIAICKQGTQSYCGNVKPNKGAGKWSCTASSP